MKRGYTAPAITRQVVLFLLLALVAGSVVAFVLYVGTPTQNNPSTACSPSLHCVNVFGLASTVEQGTHLVALDFANTKTHVNFTAPVQDGKFSISLPNGAVYGVTVRWGGNYSWQNGVMDRGDLTVNMSAGSAYAMSYNLQLETPPNTIAVHGAILWSLPAAHPINIVYTASDGESFQAGVQNGTFSTRLPNMMEYQVKVFWQYADGTTDYLFAPNQTVSEGVGVVGLDLEIK